MISNLSNSFGVLSLYHAVAKTGFVSACNMQLRDIHLYQPMLKSVEERLGLPTKPKRPTTPYFRFMSEVQPSVRAKNPKLKQTELTSMIGKMWKSMDDTKKQKYAKGYKEEIAAYQNEITTYKRNLSEDDVKRIREMVVEIKDRKAVVLQRKKTRDLGRPKKPTNSFVRFLNQQTDRQSKEEYKDYVKRVSVKWNSLSDAEKEKFKPSAQEEEAYKKSLLQWEDKMRKLGHFDVVSAQSSPKIETSKPRTRKSPTK